MSGNAENACDDDTRRFGRVPAGAGAVPAAAGGSLPLVQGRRPGDPMARGPQRDSVGAEHLRLDAPTGLSMTRRV